MQKDREAEGIRHFNPSGHYSDTDDVCYCHPFTTDNPSYGGTSYVLFKGDV